MAPISAFTLIELLIVIGIIAILSVISVPALRGLGQSNIMASANRQLLDHVAYARQYAIVNRTTVYMVFMPPQDAGNSAAFTSLSGSQKTNILSRQLTSYAFFAKRVVGDQPGRETPQYIRGWESLPEGVFIPRWKFDASRASAGNGTEVTNGAALIKVLPFDYRTDIPLPDLTDTRAVNVPVPYIAFDSQGRLVQRNPPVDEEIIPLARGSIFIARDAVGALDWAEPDVQEKPPDNSRSNPNLIRIDWLTGRARLDRPEIQ